MSRRIKQVDIAAELLLQLLTVGDVTEAEKRLHCVEGLPKGASLIAARTAFDGRTLQLMFSHDSFEEVPDNEHPPMLVCTFQATDLNAVEALKQLENA